MSLDYKISRRSFLAIGGKTLSVIGVFSLPLSQAFADDGSKQVVRLQGGYRASRNYAETLDGIGVTIFWGTSPETDEKYGGTKEDVGQEIQRLFASAGIESQVNFEPLEGRDHGGIQFHTGKQVSEPISVNQFLKEYSEPDPKKQLLSMKRAISDYRVAVDLKN